MKITATLIKNHITKILYFFLIFHIKKWRLGTFFITLASLANCALLVLVCIGCAHLCKKEEDNLVNIALLVESSSI